MNKLFHVKALIKDPDEPSGFRSIWHFNAILARTKAEAISECKWTMKSVMGQIPKYVWVAEFEYADNMAVN